jgi:hypothetical protein
MFLFLIRETHLGEIRTAQNLSLQPRYLIGVRKIFLLLFYWANNMNSMFNCACVYENLSSADFNNQVEHLCTEFCRRGRIQMSSGISLFEGNFYVDQN